MFENDQYDNLKKMYKCFSRDGQSLKHMVSRMGPYITKRGEAIIMDENIVKDAKEFSTKLLALKQAVDELVENAFNNEIGF